MPYNNETREFWLDENEKAWVATHEAEWTECLQYANGDTQILSHRIDDRMMRKWAIEYVPAVHDPSKVITQKVGSRQYKILRLWLTWNKEKKADAVYLVDGLGKGRRLYEKTNVDLEDIVFVDLQSETVRDKYRRVFVKGNGAEYWNRQG